MTKPPRSTRNLTGVWNGLYTYPYKLEAVFFMATLVEADSALSGSVNETCTIESPVGRPLLATVSGRHQGDHVAFLKSYDSGWTHSVDYTGRLNADGTEIEGAWSILGDWSGTFLMIRADGRTDAAVRRMAESVRAPRSLSRSGRGRGRNGPTGSLHGRAVQPRPR